MKIEIEITPDEDGNHTASYIFDGQLQVCSVISILEKTGKILEQKVKECAKKQIKKGVKPIIENIKINELL